MHHNNNLIAPIIQIKFTYKMHCSTKNIEDSLSYSIKKRCYREYNLKNTFIK